MSKSVGKDQVNYWRSRLKERSGSLYVRLKIDGRQYDFVLNTMNASKGAALARDIWLTYRTEGLDEALRLYHPRAWRRRQGRTGMGLRADEVPLAARVAGSGSGGRVGPGTIGDAVRAGEMAMEAGKIQRRTWQSYTKALRAIGAQIAGVDPALKFVSVGPNAGKWQAAVDALPLTLFSEEAVRLWEHERIAGALEVKEARARGKRVKVAEDHLAKEKRKRTVASMLQDARALFAKKVRVFGTWFLYPDPLPMQEIETPYTTVPHQTLVNREGLLQAAYEELRLAEPHAYVIMLLAMGAGLRTKEIDRLEMAQLDLSGECGLLHVRGTAYMTPKSRNSVSTRPLDPEVTQAIREYLSRTPVLERKFLLEGPEMRPVGNLDAGEYRAEKVLDRLCGWLRAHGVTAQKPIHYLRKEFVTMIAGTHGILAASRAARHGSIQLTSAVYTGQIDTVTPGLKLRVLPPEASEEAI